MQKESTGTVVDQQVDQPALTYRCPHCGETVKAEPQPNGEKVSCPSCRKPFAPAAPVASPLPPDQARVSGERAPLADDAEKVEVEVERFRPAMFQAYPFRTVFYVLIACGGAVALATGLYQDEWLVWVPGVAALLFGLFKLLRWYARTRSTEIQITNRRLVITQGMLRGESVEVAHSNINDVYVNRDTMNRITGVGDILISTKGEDARTVILMSVVDPERVADLIRAQRPAAA